MLCVFSASDSGPHRVGAARGRPDVARRVRACVWCTRVASGSRVTLTADADRLTRRRLVSIELAPRRFFYTDTTRPDCRSRTPRTRTARRDPILNLRAAQYDRTNGLSLQENVCLWNSSLTNDQDIVISHVHVSRMCARTPHRHTEPTPTPQAVGVAPPARLDKVLSELVVIDVHSRGQQCGRRTAPRTPVRTGCDAARKPAGKEGSARILRRLSQRPLQ